MISSKERLQWQAQDDARVMAEYQAIMGDSKRMSRAVKEAQRQAKELNSRASAMNKVAATKRKK